jgi:hypothetical protein
MTRSLTVPIPLAFRFTTFIIIALVLSVFIELSSPRVSNKIVSFSDKIFRYPAEQLNLFAINIMPELIAGNNNFYDQIDKLIAGNKKIKTDYILKNKNNIENIRNDKAAFIITREDLLGMPVKAYEDNNDQINKETWQTKVDIVLQKISNSADKVLDYMSKKQTEASLKIR